MTWYAFRTLAQFEQAHLRMTYTQMIGTIDNYRKRLSDTWWLLSMRLRTRLGHGQYLILC